MPEKSEGPLTAACSVVAAAWAGVHNTLRATQTTLRALLEVICNVRELEFTSLASI
jgi:hypothetical protein